MGPTSRPKDFASAKICDLDSKLVVQKQILWFEITVRIGRGDGAVRLRDDQEREERDKPMDDSFLVHIIKCID